MCVGTFICFISVTWHLFCGWCTQLNPFLLFQGDFFITYILTDGLSGFSLEILQPGLLLWDLIKSLTYRHGKEKEPYLYSLPYFRVIPVVSLAMLIGMVYALVVPLLVPFLICYFCLGYVVYINQVCFIIILVSNSSLWINWYSIHPLTHTHAHLFYMLIQAWGLLGCSTKKVSRMVSNIVKRLD